MSESQRAARAGTTHGRPGRPGAIALLGLAGLLLACGGGPATRAPASDPGGVSDARPAPDESAPARDPDAPPAGDPGTHAEAAGPVTEADCDALLAHVVSLANAAHVQTVPPEQAPTDEQLADIRARMAPKFVPMCLSLDRATFGCQMRARTRDELLACMP